MGGIQSQVSCIFKSAFEGARQHSPFMSGQLPVRMGEVGRVELRRGCPGPLFQEAAHSGGLCL